MSGWKEWMAVAALLAATTGCAAQQTCCQQCGCSAGCRKVCRLVCEEQETVKVTYECKCEDFCVPGPSRLHRHDCTCGQCDDCRRLHWVPCSAELHTRKVLVRHEEVVKKPVFKWVVQSCCSQCAAQ